MKNKKRTRRATQADGGNTIVRNVAGLLRDYTALSARKVAIRLYDDSRNLHSFTTSLYSQEASKCSYIVTECAVLRSAADR
jgi:hypothetical protein